MTQQYLKENVFPLNSVEDYWKKLRWKIKHENHFRLYTFPFQLARICNIRNSFMLYKLEWINELYLDPTVLSLLFFSFVRLLTNLKYLILHTPFWFYFPEKFNNYYFFHPSKNVNLNYIGSWIYKITYTTKN